MSEGIFHSCRDNVINNNELINDLKHILGMSINNGTDEIRITEKHSDLIKITLNHNTEIKVNKKLNLVKKL